MLLINGAKGIGTGFSTDIMCYNPKQIIEHIKNRLSGIDVSNEEFVPYYQGFKGSIAKIESHKYLIKGCYEKTSANKIRITELPIGTWTEDYKIFVEKEIDAKRIKDISDMSTDKVVDMTITFAKGVLEKLDAECATKTVSYGIEGNTTTSVDPIEKYLKLTTTKTTSNMYLFDSKEQLRKFDSVNAIIDAYFVERRLTYVSRIKNIIEKLEGDLLLLSNKARFVTENLSGEVDLRGKKKDAINAMLTEKKYDKINEDFKYLIKMPMDSVCEENVAKLLEEKGTKEQELDFYKKITVEELWMSELKQLEKNLIEKKPKVKTSTSKDKGNGKKQE
jgi:DNA topoisomerase-2